MSRRKPAPADQNLDGDDGNRHSQYRYPFFCHDYHARHPDRLCSLTDSVEDQENHGRQPPERYQPGQLLPTIMTGETLDLEDPPSSAHDHDPFTDPHSRPNSFYTDHSDTRPLSQYSQHSNRSLPQPPASVPIPVVGTPFSSTTTVYAHGLSAQYSGSVDHFQHDTEAFASGVYPRQSYHPPRSRSPTPFGDDEDYRLDENNVAHYTGYSKHYNVPEQFDDDDEYNVEYDISQYADVPDDELGFQESERTPSLSTSIEPETPIATMHFGPAPIGRVRRRLKKKRVQLTNGNLVVDLSVPPKLVLPYRGEQEMTKTRYTAVTCDPDDYEKEKFFLRQNESGRTTELFIVITMYNVRLARQVYFFFEHADRKVVQEDEVLFCRTMYGVMRNIAHLCSRKNSQTWGPDAWKKVCHSFETHLSSQADVDL